MVENALFPSEQFRVETDLALTHVLSEAVQRCNDGPVVPTLDLAKLQTELAAFDFAAPRSLNAVLMWTIAQMERGLVHVNHPRYFGLFNPTPTFPAQCADRITAAFNPQLATSVTSPTAVAIESHVVNAVAARLGLSTEAQGHFTTGGSEANYTALLLALTRACPKFADEGARAFAGPPVLYVSRDSHTAWLKIAHQVGIGRSALRWIATDGFGRLDIMALQQALHEDRASGCIPILIAATAGTTNAGMIDPLEACADIAQVWKVWYHVDAAWGGGLIASNKFRDRLIGIESADSITIDAHKWFATTMGCGVFVTRHPTVLSSAFRASTTYMPSNNASVDPYVTTVQWSRRFLGLRLFLGLATAGWDGYGAHVEHSLTMIDELKKQLATHNWMSVNDSSVGVLCFVPPHEHLVRPIVARVVASGAAWVSMARFEGREVIRACVTSGLTRVEDVTELVTTLLSASEIIYQQEQQRG